MWAEWSKVRLSLNGKICKVPRSSSTVMIFMQLFRNKYRHHVGGFATGLKYTNMDGCRMSDYVRCNALGHELMMTRHLSNCG